MKWWLSLPANFRHLNNVSYLHPNAPLALPLLLPNQAGESLDLAVLIALHNGPLSGRWAKVTRCLWLEFLFYDIDFYPHLLPIAHAQSQQKVRKKISLHRKDGLITYSNMWGQNVYEGLQDNFVKSTVEGQ